MIVIIYLLVFICAIFIAKYFYKQWQEHGSIIDFITFVMYFITDFLLLICIFKLIKL